MYAVELESIGRTFSLQLGLHQSTIACVGLVSFYAHQGGPFYVLDLL
jgi:hypothetical protein